MDFFKKDEQTALQAKYEAQKLAFGPIAFQVTKLLKDLAILKEVHACKKGLSLEDVVQKTGLNEYGVRVLMEAGLGLKIFCINDNQYTLTKIGHFILFDPMTQVNLNFVNDVCYQGLFFLKESILNGKPEGLKVFGTKWQTIYEALSSLPDQVQKSWLAFDHFYSDLAFPEVLPFVFKQKPQVIFDLGGNTGRFALQCVKHSPTVQVTILDLSNQLEMAAKNIKTEGDNRIFFHSTDLLDPDSVIPEGADVIWMSQFLDCFSEEQIVAILKKAGAALNDKGAITILETYWDRQRFEAAAFCLQQTSLYFTAMANGNSQMYHSKNMIQCIHAAGLYVEEDVDHIGIGHTLFRCKKRPSF